MTQTRTDGRAAQVWTEIIDLLTLSNYIMDTGTTVLSREVTGSESLDIPELATPTVTSLPTDGSSPTATPQHLEPAANKLVVGTWDGIIAEIPKLSRVQNMMGAWANSVAWTLVQTLRNNADAMLANLLAFFAAWDTVGQASHANNGGDALSLASVNTAIARLTKNKGVAYQNLVVYVHPFGEASLKSIPSYIPHYEEAEKGSIGLPLIGRLNGIPCYMTQSVPCQPQVTASASAIAGGVATYTVPSGHGLVPGQKITTAGFTRDITTPAVISSVGPTSVVAPNAGGDVGGNGGGVITEQSCHNLIVNRRRVWSAFQQAPDVRIVPVATAFSDNLQCDQIYGFKTRQAPGTVVVLHSPPDSA